MNTNSNAVDALKPCPFCGGEAVLTSSVNDKTSHKALCGNPNCQATSRVYKGSDTAAITAWNTRASLTTTEDGDICDGCDNAYKSVFRVPDEVWSQIAPKPDSLGEHIEHQYGGLLCLNCADYAARKSGITLVWEARLNWGDTTEDGLGGELIEELKDLEYVSVDGWGYLTIPDELRDRIITALSPSPSGDVVEAKDVCDNCNLSLAANGGCYYPECDDPQKPTTPQHTTSPDALLREAWTRVRPLVQATIQASGGNCQLVKDQVAILDQHRQEGQS